MASESKLTAVIEAQDNATKTLQKVQGSVEETGKTTAEIGKKMVNAGLAIGAVGAGLTAYSKSATTTMVAYAGSVGSISKQTGEGTENVSRLLYAMNRSGIEAGAASQVFGIFSKQITDANTAADRSETSLGKLNVATKNADGSARGFNTILFDVADKFKTMPDGAEKTALAMEIFGKQGKQLLPVLNQGSAGLEEMGKQADKLGLTLTQKNLVAVKAYTKANKDLKDQQQSLTIAVGTEALPMWTKLAQATTGAVTAFVGAPEPIHSMTVAILALGGPIMTAAGTLLALTANISTATGVQSQGQIEMLAKKIPLIGTAFSAVLSVGLNPWVIGIALAVGAIVVLLMLLGQFQPLLQTLQTGFMTLWNLFVTAMKPALDSLVFAWNQLVVSITPALPLLKTIAEVLGIIVVGAILGALMAIAALVVGFTYLVSGTIMAVNLIIQYFKGLFNFIMTAPGQALNGLVAAFNWGLNSAAAAIANGLRGIESRISSFSLYDSGVKMLQTFVNGLNAMWQNVYNNVSGGLGKVRKLLPFSDAKEGPLSTLTLSGKRMMTTLAEGVMQGQDSLHSAVSDALSLPQASISAGMTGGGSGSGNGGDSSGGSGPGITISFYGDVNLSSDQNIDDVARRLGRQMQAARAGAF